MPALPLSVTLSSTFDRVEWPAAKFNVYCLLSKLLCKIEGAVF